MCGLEYKHPEDDYKLLLFGSPRSAIKEVELFDDRLLKLTFIPADRTIDLFTANLLQTGRPDAKKVAFWQLTDTKATKDYKVPPADYIVIEVDLNGRRQ